MGVVLTQQQYNVRQISPEDGDDRHQRKAITQYEADVFAQLAGGKTKTNIFSHNLMSPGCFDFLDDILLFSLFRDDADLEERGYHYGFGDQVEIKVKVSGY
jgi:hypothetical protein